MSKILRGSRHLLVGTAIAAGTLVAAGTPALAAAPAQAGTAAAPAQVGAVVTPASANQCSRNAFGNPLVCLFVHGTGLHVDYATVTNVGAPAGKADISNSGSGATHVGDFLKKGESWRYDFNRSLKDGVKICGSINGLDTVCITVHD